MKAKILLRQKLARTSEHKTSELPATISHTSPVGQAGSDLYRNARVLKKRQCPLS